MARVAIPAAVIRVAAAVENRLVLRVRPARVACLDDSGYVLNT